MVITGQEEMHCWISQQSDNTRIVAVPIRYVQELGWKTAALLSQMLWWAGKTSNPQRRFYHTQQEWQEELALSEHDVKSGLKKLESLGLVRIMVGRQPKDKLKKTSWYEVVFEKISQWWKSTFTNGENHSSLTVKITDSYIKRKKEEKKVKEEQAHSANGEPEVTCKEGSEENMAFPKSTKGKVGVSADEIKAVLRTQSKDPLKEAKKEGKLTDLLMDWKRALAKYHTNGELVGNPKHTEKMMLNTFMKKCNTLGVSYRYTLVWAIKEWIGFAKYVQSQRGLANVPIFPTISFLVYYVDDAIRFVKKETEPVAVATTSAVNCTAPKTPVKLPTVATNKSATLEEIEAIGKKYFGKG